MFDYSELRQTHGKKVNQTIDSPITIFDFWQLSDGVLALVVILVFGVILFSWMPMVLLLVAILGLMPFLRSVYPKGIFLHWPYRYLNITLPGLLNPKGERTYL